MESLDFRYPINICDLSMLLQKCPNLEKLQLSADMIVSVGNKTNSKLSVRSSILVKILLGAKFPVQVNLPKLEVLVCSARYGNQYDK